MLRNRFLMKFMTRRYFGILNMPQWLKRDDDAIYVHVHANPGSKSEPSFSKLGDKYVELNVSQDQANTDKDIETLFKKWWPYDVKVKDDQSGHGKTVELRRGKEKVQDSWITDLKEKFKKGDIL